MIYEEKKYSRWMIITLLCAFFVIMYPFWDLGLRDLTREEGFSAAVVSGITSFPPSCFVHGELVSYVYPLYPLLTKILTSLGLSMAFALRLISVLSLGGLSLMTGIIGYRMAGLHAGAAASCAVFCSALACGTAVEGSGRFLTALLIFAGHQAWFNAGRGKGSWSAGWIFVGLFAGLAFYCEGVKALFYFFLPMIFFMRPYTPYRRFNHSGFLLGILLFAAFILCWIIPRWMPEGGSGWIPEAEYTSLTGYALFLLEKPLKACLLLMPFLIFAFAPFCPALIEIDRNPLYSKYLRVIFVVSACIYILNPFGKEGDLVYLLGSFSLLIGLNYDIVVRRHGDLLCKLLQFAVAAGILLCVGGVIFLLMQDQILLSLGMDGKYLRGREGDTETLALVKLACGILCGGAAGILIHRRSAVFVIILLTITIYTSFFWAIVNPYRCGERSRSRLGYALRDSLQNSYSPGMTVYKDDAIAGLYSECHYLGTKIKSVSFNSADFPRDKQVFLLSVRNIQPPDTSRSWTRITDVIYKNQNLYMWKGTPNDRKERPDDDIRKMQF